MSNEDTGSTTPAAARPAPQEVFSGGATTSQHVDAHDDEHFENTTFKLKRTRSLGLLDEFIDPDKQAERIEDKADARAPANAAPAGESVPEPAAGSPEAAIAVPKDFQLPDLVPHDDADITPEPLQLVDYLLHQWDVTDILKLWRYIVSKRNTVANAARLENALWRTWAQRRGNLRTILPECINWLKDLDVLWLYGPIMKEDKEDDDPHRQRTATLKVAGDILLPRQSSKELKPILKRRTAAQLIILHSNLLKLELVTNKMYQQQRQEYQQRVAAMKNAPKPEFFDYDAILGRLNKQYHQAAGPLLNSLLTRIQELLNKPKPPAVPEAPAEPRAPLEALAPRHIRFNELVEQCQAVDGYLDDEFRGPATQAIYLDLDDDDDDEDEDGGFFLSVRPLGGMVAGVGPPSDLELERLEATLGLRRLLVQTIQRLAPTTINYGLLEEELDDDNPYTLLMSHNALENRGYDYYYDYNRVYTNDLAGVKTPEVVDIPESLNLEYEDEAMPPLALPVVLPVVMPSRPAPLPQDPDSALDSDDGLSISAPNSSKDLAQLVFGMTSHFPDTAPHPVEAPVALINPNSLTALLSKQPRSLGLLAASFFGDGEPPRSQLLSLFLGDTAPPSPPSVPMPPHAGLPRQKLGFLFDLELDLDE